MKLFSMDCKFLETFNKITDLVTLNILWLLCCIPIITIGASTSALYQDVYKSQVDAPPLPHAPIDIAIAPVNKTAKSLFVLFLLLRL